jgi:hypothetical protein
MYDNILVEFSELTDVIPCYAYSIGFESPVKTPAFTSPRECIELLHITRWLQETYFGGLSCMHIAFDI